MVLDLGEEHQAVLNGTHNNRSSTVRGQNPQETAPH